MLRKKLKAKRHQDRGERNGRDPAAARRRLLLIEDDASVAESFTFLMQSLNHEVRITPDRQATLAVLDNFIPEFVFLDLSLRGLDCREFSHELRNRPGLEQVILVAITGQTPHEDALRLEGACFDVQLANPIAVDQLEKLFANSGCRTGSKGQAS